MEESARRLNQQGASESQTGSVRRVRGQGGSHSMEVAEPLMTDFGQCCGDQPCPELARKRVLDQEVEAVAMDHLDQFCYKREQRHGELARGGHGSK